MYIHPVSLTLCACKGIITSRSGNCSTLTSFLHSTTLVRIHFATSSHSTHPGMLLGLGAVSRGHDWQEALGLPWRIGGEILTVRSLGWVRGLLGSEVGGSLPFSLFRSCFLPRASNNNNIGKFCKKRLIKNLGTILLESANRHRRNRFK